MVLEKSFVFYSCKGGVGKSTLLYNTLGALVQDNKYADCNLLVIDCSLYHDISRKLVGDIGLEVSKLQAIPENCRLYHTVNRLGDTPAVGAADLNFDNPTELAKRVELPHFSRSGDVGVFLMSSHPDLSKKFSSIPPTKAHVKGVAGALRKRLEDSAKKWIVIADTDAEFHNLTRVALALCDEAFFPVRLHEADWFRLEVSLNRLQQCEGRRAQVSRFLINDVGNATDKIDGLLTVEVDGKLLPRFKIAPPGAPAKELLSAFTKKIFERFQSDQVGGVCAPLFKRHAAIAELGETQYWFEVQYCEVVRGLEGTLLMANAEGVPITALSTPGLSETNKKCMRELTSTTRRMFNDPVAKLSELFDKVVI